MRMGWKSCSCAHGSERWYYTEMGRGEANIAAVCLLIGALAACSAKNEPRKTDLDAIEIAPPPSTVRRLTESQYNNAVRDLFGAELAAELPLDVDVTIGSFASVGGSYATVSPIGVERYESAARRIAEQAVESAAVFKRIVPCTPRLPEDTACLSAFSRAFGLRAWRRDLTDDEADQLAALGEQGAQAFGRFKEGVRVIISTVLQSPHFLFRREVGADGQFSDWEMASRLSFFLNNTTPDDELLAAASDGRLHEEGDIRRQAIRLLAKPEARQAVRNFFSELLQLADLHRLSKDTTIFPAADAGFGADAREETLLLVDHLVFDLDADIRRLLTSAETFVNPRLADLYGISAPDGDAFAIAPLPESTYRRGFLGHASFLAKQAHATGTSAVLRGKFVSTVFLCRDIPAPPPSLNTGFSETLNARTLRERSAAHAKQPECAACHSLMDPIGLGFENFDGIGRWRQTEKGAAIDSSGELDGAKFYDAAELSEAVAANPAFGTCMAKNVYRYATGRMESLGETAFVDALGRRFAEDGYRMNTLFLQLASSRAFRTAGANP